MALRNIEMPGAEVQIALIDAVENERMAYIRMRAMRRVTPEEQADYDRHVELLNKAYSWLHDLGIKR